MQYHWCSVRQPAVGYHYLSNCQNLDIHAIFHPCTCKQSDRHSDVVYVENSGSSLPLSQICTVVVWNSDAITGFKNLLTYAEKIPQYPVNNSHTLLTYHVLYMCVYKHNTFSHRVMCQDLIVTKQGDGRYFQCFMRNKPLKYQKEDTFSGTKTIQKKNCPYNHVSTMQ